MPPPPPPPRSYYQAPNWNLPQFNFRWLWRGLVAFVLFLILLSCYSSVPADSVGVLLRFGKFHEIIQPGLVFKLPLDDLHGIELPDLAGVFGDRPVAGEFAHPRGV
jgi:hypothetical protein